MLLQNMKEYSMQESSKERYNPDAIRNLDSDFISVECLEKLGLDENPFVDHAKEPFLFMDQQIEMSINVLVDYLQNQNSTLVLLGEIGVGKTTYLRILLRKGYQHFNFCTLRAKSDTSFEEIENKIKERWRIPQRDTDEEIPIEEYIKEYIELDKNPVLVIDDAHRLESQVLDSLLQLKHRVGLQSSQVLGLVLSSEPNIQPKLTELEQTNPAATQIYQSNVRIFDANQCERYINFRLQKAGASSLDLFDSEIIDEILVKSNGLPRIINKLARETLSKQCQNLSKLASTKYSTNSSSGLRLGIVLAGLIGLAFIIVALLKKTDETIEVELDTPELRQEIIQEQVAETQIENTEPIIEEPVIEEPIVEDKQKNTIQKPYVAPLVLGPSQLEDEYKTTETHVKVEAQTETKNESNKEEKLPFDSHWLLKQNPDAFTIQVVASANKDNLFTFAKSNLANKQTAFYIKSANDKQWYVLVYGVFSTRENALEEIKALPQNIQKNKPYPLQIKSIHQAIR